MQEPIKLFDYLHIVTSCRGCGHRICLPFSLVLTGQEIECPVCDYAYGFGLGGDLAPKIEEGFQKIQAQLRDEGCWVEVRPYP